MALRQGFMSPNDIAGILSNDADNNKYKNVRDEIHKTDSGKATPADPAQTLPVENDAGWSLTQMAVVAFIVYLIFEG